jgi:hypothetical protein
LDATPPLYSFHTGQALVPTRKVFGGELGNRRLIHWFKSGIWGRGALDKWRPLAVTLAEEVKSGRFAAFDSVEDLEDGIIVLLKDEHIVVEPIKNRLDPNYDITATLGYCDVNVNLRVLKSPLASQSEEDWLKLGLSEHVCEIQLALKEYFLRSKEEAHQNHIQYRNLRAE